MANYLKVSAIKAKIKEKGKRCSMDYIDSLDKLVEETINDSVEQSKTVTIKELPE